MKGFISAIQFLTSIPIGTKRPIDESKLPQAMIYFPLIGLFLGLILAAANNILSLTTLGQFPISAILVVLLIILTGGLHLDGLADTFDAFLSGKGRSDMLAIMRDSRIGTMGALSLISVILIKVSLISSLGPEIMNSSLILMCALSRYFLVFSIFFFPYAREGGKAKPFFDGINLKIFSLATLMGLFFCAIFFDIKGLMIFVITAFLLFLVNRIIANKIGGLTGDTLGAVNELCEICILIAVLI